jgi:hypothetical protein
VSPLNPTEHPLLRKQSAKVILSADKNRFVDLKRMPNSAYFSFLLAILDVPQTDIPREASPINDSVMGQLKIVACQPRWILFRP